uniref:Exostosin-like 3 n=1 Tax=Globodera rostochiensis TaxID=31243 RepID=A0A914GS44_GLORO
MLQISPNFEKFNGWKKQCLTSLCLPRHWRLKKCNNGRAMWQKRRRPLRWLFSGGRFLQLAFALFFLLIFLTIFVTFSSKRSIDLNIPWNGRHSLRSSAEIRSQQNAAGDGNLAPSKCCECGGGGSKGWRSHFVPAETEARVFQSVRREHIELLGKLDEAQAKLDAIDKKIPEREAELAKLELRVEELQLLRKEYSDSRSVRVQLPHFPLMRRAKKGAEDRKSEIAEQQQFEDNHFDFSRCSITDPSMPLFVYPLNTPTSSLLATHFHRQFVSGQHIASITTTPARACLFVAIIDQQNGTNAGTLPFNRFGTTEGRNHLVLDLHGRLGAVDQQRQHLGSAVLITPRSDHSTIRSGHFVFPLHLDVPVPSADRWRTFPALLPVMRKYFVSLVTNPALLNERQLNDLAELKKSLDSSQDAHLIDLECPLGNNSSPFPSDHFCYAAEDRLRMGRQSLFTILFPELPFFQQLFYESLATGSIPVVCSHRAPFPFGRLIDWRLATVRILPDRFPELHFILRAIPSADLIELKRKGRFFFEHFLADTKVVVHAILSAMRVLLQLPGGEQPEPETVPLYSSNSSSTFPSFVSTFIKPPYDDEYLGPIELPLESLSYVHNFTALSLYSDQIWNHFPMAIGTSPRFLPFAHFLPSDAEFGEDTAFGMRPILPGSGQEFALALGGNRPREQFTVIILAYNREQVLLNTLERLNNLPHLNRVIVVWNDVNRLPSIPAWPRLHVPVLFINGTRNSLNNRFIPYKEIETEAIFSMDDDMDIKQFEIVFAFRVWREHRDRIVGFPARFHARFGDDNFYNSNHTCQYSMILTGAAFIHKFYLHAYTYHMPAIIRLTVDEWMNCEDLAMNFLVAHLTRKAPIKTTSKWTLRCPSCPEMLSNDETHFVERHQCIRFFTRVYGYNPLVFSQFRADSVLFKTRVPQNHQKCFRYV